MLQASDRFLFVFYDFEINKNNKYSASATVHVPNLVCLQQFCSRYENIQDMNIDYKPICTRMQAFWDDPVGDLLTFFCKPRPWCSKMVGIAHNAKAFDLRCLVNRAILLKWKPELILKWLKILFMKMEHIKFVDTISNMTCSLRKSPKGLE